MVDTLNPPRGYIDPATVPPRRARPILTLAQFRQLEAVLRAAGYDDMIAWSENLLPPRDCRAFAEEAIYVICNSGMRVTVANPIYWRCVRALARGKSAASVFGHPGKAAAIDHIWMHRKVPFAAYQIAENKLVHCATSGAIPLEDARLGSATRNANRSASRSPSRCGKNTSHGPSSRRAISALNARSRSLNSGAAR